MPIHDVAELVEALARSQALEPDQEELVRSSLAPSAAELADLARELVRRRWMTLWQLKQIFSQSSPHLVLGQYVLLDVLGEGGMGRVYRARHRRLDRIDALKVVRAEHLASEDALRRFLREARAAARLSHPNIVAIHDSDEIGGTHFLAMELIDGIDLARLVREEGPLPPAQACEYLRQAALGLQHAHERGLVHRDIKPANLLVTADGTQVKILDMGLARLHAAEDGPGSGHELTRTGAVMGTPDYMAPEQAIDSRRTDIRADIYSLGCTLYFLLTGGPPFPAGSLAQKLLWHQQQEPDPLEARRPDLPAGLPELVRRMMAKRPEDRPTTPQEVARALEPFASSTAAPDQDTGAATLAPPSGGAAGGSIEEMDFSFCESAVAVRPAASPGPADATVDLPSRPGQPTGEPATALLHPARPQALAAGDRTTRLADPAEEQEASSPRAAPRRPRKGRRSRAEREKPEGVSWWNVVGVAGFLVTAVIVGWPWLRAYLPSSPSPPAPAPGQAAPTVGEVRPLAGHEDTVWGIAFAPDGKRLASVSKDRTLRIWTVPDGTEERRLEGFPGPVLSTAWSPTQDLLLTGGVSPAAGPNGTHRLWNLGAPREKAQRVVGLTSEPVLCVAFTPDGRFALSGGGREKGDIHFWEVTSGLERHLLSGHTKPVLRLAVSPDGKQAASCSLDATVRLWSLETGAQIHAFPAGGDRVVCLAYSPDGRLLATGGEDRAISLWQAATREPAGRLTGHTQEVLALAFSRDGKRLISGGADRTVRVWDIPAKKLLHTFTGHADVVTGVAASPDGAHAASCSQDRTVRLWRLPE